MATRFGTEVYLKENLEARALRKIFYAPSGANHDWRNIPYSITWQLWKRIQSLTGLKSYALEILLGRRWLMSTYKMHQIFSNKYAIVCGNGPSQGFLDIETLALAKSRGFHLVVINFFLENKNFYEVAPDIFVLSDWAAWKDVGEVDDMEAVARKRGELRSFIESRTEIKIFCPARFAREMALSVGAERIYGFSDSELRGWTTNIAPIFPRGYLSMTAYKALSVCIWLGYKTIYIIGIDNTYPREVYCDIDNRLMERATHACALPYLRVLEGCYQNMGEYLSSIAEHFHDLRVFPRDSIVNLDEFSLTDRFKKVKMEDFRGLIENSDQ